MDKRKELRDSLKELTKESLSICNAVAEAKKGDILGIGTDYQRWYTKALKVIEVLAPDRLEEFVNYYRIDTKRKVINAGNYVIQDYVMGLEVRNKFGEPEFNGNQVCSVKIYNQMQILQSLETRIDYVLANVQGVLLSELQDKELETAEELLKINARGAGSLAGVILENHLQRVMQNHHITISKKNPTISEMNNLLRSNEIYDLTTWKKVEYLGSIRNLCSHKKEREPKKEEVEDLISGANKIIKEVF